VNESELLNQLGRQAPAPAGGEFLPSGSVAVDILLGGGWPAGAISELCGPQEYTAPFAYRTVAAVQRAWPDEPVLMCCGDYSTALASRYHVDEGRLLVTRSQTAAACESSARLAIVDRPLDSWIPVRDDTSLSMLFLTMTPGALVRSAACVRLSPVRGSRTWATAERTWASRPARTILTNQIPVCLGPDSSAQEILELALRLDIATRRARYLRYGDDKLGGSWEEAVDWLTASPRMRMRILEDIAARAPLHPAWRHVYAQ
jgi:hypothetical protein